MTAPDVPASVALPTIAVAFLVPVAGVWCAGLGARSARLERPLRLGLLVMVGLAAWGAVVVLLAEARLLWGEAGDLTGIWLPLGWLLPMLGLLWLLRHTPRLREALASRAGMAWLASTMSARTLGVVFLTLHGRDQLPTLFAYPAAIGDVLIGVTAPAAAWVLAFRTSEVHRHGSPWRAAIITWNALGFAEMLMAVSLGTMLFPGPLQLVHEQPTTALFARLPLVLFPTYLVCFASTVHLFLLDVLLGRRRSADQDVRLISGQAAQHHTAPAR
ncbi:MAG TPA: hypothetical protein VM386_07885 [Acidimicrobiales bacterium]|nr:hypothetical protein [Acidimicrobiales bacterium]